MSLLDSLKNLINGNITVHQEFINKLIKEALGENKVVKGINLSIGEGFLNATVEILAGESTPVHLEFMLSMSEFEFNKSHRFIEFILRSPITVTVYGVNIKTKLEAELDEDQAKRSGAPEGLVNLFNYLKVKEDKVILDFNKIPGFNQVLQNKLGFILNNLEINKLDLLHEMIVIHPTIKFF